MRASLRQRRPGLNWPGWRIGRAALPVFLGCVFLVAGGVRALGAGFENRPYLQNPGKAQMTVMWSSRSGSTCVLKYGIGAPVTAVNVDPSITTYDAGATGDQTEHIFEHQLTGLTAGTEYAYEVTCDGETLSGTFRTFPESDPDFTFIAYGDTRSQPGEHSQVTARFAQHEPKFVLHSGDMLGSGEYQNWKPWFFDPLSEVIRDVPICPVPGNHEADEVSYRKVMSLPGNERWYSFDYGNCHFVMLSTNTQWSASENAAMRSWCEADLAASIRSGARPRTRRCGRGARRTWRPRRRSGRSWWCTSRSTT
jgi:hypothetical protein